MVSILTSSRLADCVTLLFLAAGIFYLYARYKLSYWRRRGVPSPPADLIFGNFKDALLLRASPGVEMGRMHKEAGDDSPYVGFYILHKPCLLVRSPELIKHIMLKDFNYFQNRHFATGVKKDIIGGNGLFAIDNPHWKYLRAKLSPVFTSGKLKKMFPLIVESGETMLRHFQDRFNGDEGIRTIEVKDTSAKYTTDVISSLAFGIRTNSFQVPEPEFRARSQKIFDTSLRRAVEFLVVFFFPRYMDAIGGKALGDSTEFFREIFWDSMNAREQSGATCGDLIDTLVQLKNGEQQSDYKFEGDYLVSPAAVFFLAGFETSSTTMAFAILELASHPEIQQRARRDVLDNIEKHGGMTYEAVQDMTYLAQVISETLRIQPPVPIIDRLCLQDYKIPGTDVVIEKGTPVYISLNGLQDDPKYHPEPGRFDPERFGNEKKHGIVPYTYMPFGDGPRVCIGMRLGLTMSTVGVATILRDYEIALNPQYETTLDPRAVFTAPANGIMINFKKLSAH